MKTPLSGSAHATAVWLLLVAATALSWWLVERHVLPAHLATTAALGLATFKARLVFLHFMELRSAPLLWRLLFEAWVLLCAGAILAGYWLTRAPLH
jgi:cytochrome c oxidase subunit IV